MPGRLSTSRVDEKLDRVWFSHYLSTKNCGQNADELRRLKYIVRSHSTQGVAWIFLTTHMYINY